MDITADSWIAELWGIKLENLEMKYPGIIAMIDRWIEEEYNLD